MPSAKVSDIAVYYEVHGQTGSPVLMIAGLGMSKAGWWPEFVDCLQARHQVIIFDNRGVGQSDKPTSPYAMAQFAADSVGLLDALQIDRAHVAGASMGGMIAQHIAIRYPERLLSLVLGCTMPGSPHGVPAQREVIAQLTAPPSGDPAQDMRAGWPLVYTPAFIATQRAQLERRLAAELAYPIQPRFAWELQLQSVVDTHDASPEQLSAIDCPTLVQCGTEDVLVPPENSRILARVIPGAELIEYPGCGHGYMDEAAPRPALDIMAFLAKVDQERA